MTDIEQKLLKLLKVEYEMAVTDEYKLMAALAGCRVWLDDLADIGTAIQQGSSLTPLQAETMNHIVDAVAFADGWNEEQRLQLQQCGTAVCRAQGVSDGDMDSTPDAGRS